LQTRNGASPERTLGVTEGVNKFLAVDDLSASESDMEIDDGDGSDTESVRESREPSHKMARVQTTTRDDGDSVPKWSNPDPYTVLPPPSETGKKKDFVQLIRKAKIQAAEKSPTSNAVTANDDFISFGDEEDEESSLPAIPPPPSGARPPEPPVPPPPPPPPSYPPTNSPPLTGSLNDVSATGMLASAGHGMKHSADSAGLPPRPSEMAPRPTKRKRDQFIGGIVEEWLSTPHTNPAPWCKNRAYTEKITEREGSDYEKMLML
jgi:non-canonical poly(A) RNA polymerase PAPD5/7